MSQLHVYAPPIIGGLLIGLAVALYLLGTGRIAGISGIFGSTLLGEAGWVRGLFLVGLIAGPWLAVTLGIVQRVNPLPSPQWFKLLLAGLLVGIGTHLGSGCTSGHGLCGLSNLSPRSLTATLIFMGVAALIVLLGFGGLQ